MSAVTKFIESQRGQKIFNFFYGTGASVVILGALFKILHLKHAETMLMLGMGTEAFLFFISALEPPFKKYEWENVYPELMKKHEHHPDGATHTTKKRSNDLLTSLKDAGELTAEDIHKLTDGIKKLGSTAQNLNEVSEVKTVTNQYVENLSKAATSIGTLSAMQIESANNIKASTSTVVDTMKELSGKMANSLSETIKLSTTALNETTSELTASYRKVSNNLTADFNRLKEDSENLQKELSGINKNLTSINAVYELQLNKAKDQLKIKEEQITLLNHLSKGIESVNENMSATIEDSKGYKNQASKLNKNIAELNNIYGNMLNALTIN